MNSTKNIGVVGKYKVVEITDQGVFIDSIYHGNLFIPHSQVPNDIKLQDTLEAFLYVDGHRVFATCKKPFLQLHQLGILTIASVDCGTAYLDMGIPKELVLPISEQKSYIETGEKVIVYVDIDEQNRLFATQKFNRYFKDTVDDAIYEHNQEVQIIPIGKTPLGIKAVVDMKYYGLLYADSIFEKLTFGKKYKGYILNQRDDGKLDLSLTKSGVQGIEHASRIILNKLSISGQLLLSDSSSPEQIEFILGMSKGKFKKAIGSLYKRKLICIYDDKIALTEDGYKYLENK